MRACWGRTLADMNINFKSAFLGNKSDQVDVLKLMVSNPQVDISMLLQYSKAFDIYQNDVLTLYSEALMPKLEAVIDKRGEVIIPNFSQVTTKVEECLELLKDDSLMFDHLNKMLTNVSPYNYTLLEFILSKIYQTRVYRDEKPGRDERI